MNIKSYHSRPEISKSDLDLLAKSPYHFKHKAEFKDESKALVLGSAVHKLVLEPLDFKNEFIIEPICDKRTKDGRAIYEKFKNEANDRYILTPSEYELALNMAKSVLDMKQTGAFLRDGLSEQSYFSTIDDVAVRCRPDFYNEKLGLVIDLKTTSDASASGFAKSVANFNYHIQNAFYTDILRANNKVVNSFLFIAVESKKPFMVGFYVLDDEAIEQGRKRYKELLNLYKICLKRDEWWGYAEFDGERINAVRELSLPAWKFYE
ncbi:PD-(D/E)XK nuclease-like domain-containing protein [Campylobacter sp. faydin G-140]|uniref:PD-(D/E)XK nuclease-like domain-containing protein n=1 Tax=Campylobacter anatolicus TaxID=2829105 RepID=UPI001B96FDB7|nr:PD-(D/E)XK nuclease-like domain-containing protein [Campylobacter anatolicus]MBR8461508.1 PD-(D/E)XK nuclease-like domain-containing protein [Campylobacter anatolicus]MBR8466211.1 PD-(D/E)XK nuclease-like domain-containing protein [Campylobacter anatolicus]